MDVLSEILKVVNLTGAVFYNAEFSAPWCVHSPASQEFAPFLSAGAKHVIVYHLVTEGAAWARLESGPPVEIRAGDIVVLPHGDPHSMGNGPSTKPLDNAQEMEWIRTRGLEVARLGGGGDVTKVICGYMACEPELFRMLLSALPPLFHVSIRDGTAGVWLENSIRFSVDQAGTSSPGGGAVLAKLSETLFVETLRRYVATLSPGETGWLAGARDPDVGKALALLHQQPARAWTLAELAETVGVSRSVLAERFREFAGEPPMTYLTRWRLQLGARMLTSTSHGVAEIASQVGYDSEAAFNRAFKREFGAPPARFRLSKKKRADE
jgi:AraC-like DNA-binding protein